ESQIAVADVDNDGYPEVFFGIRKDDNGKVALLRWDPDGDMSTDGNGRFDVAPEVFHEFDNADYPGAPVLADIDNNGTYELLTIVKEGATGHVYALRTDDGAPVSTTWAGSNTLSISGAGTVTVPRIAVGDLDGDGKLEVVYGSHKGRDNSQLYALDHKGNLLPNFPVGGLNRFGDRAPILADINDDNDVEIIINNSYRDGNGHSHGSIIAFAPDGSRLPNLKLDLNQSQDEFIQSPYVGDIDKDGKNEIVASSKNGSIYVWDTPGDADKVEWGGYRHDARNTAAYEIAPCVFNPNSGVDLSIRDGKDDMGEEPYTGDNKPWES